MTPDGRHARVVVAHADDETLGCGATIAWLVQLGWMVDVVIVSDGSVRRGDVVVDNRPAAVAACLALGARAPEFLGLADQRFAATSIADVAAELSDATVPNLILTHDAADLNSDHRYVAEAALVAWRPGPRAPSILACEIPGSTAWSGQPFRPNYYVDASATLDVKVRALAEYHHELRDAPHPRSEHGVRATAAYHGLQAGCAAAEAFRVVRAVAGRSPE